MKFKVLAKNKVSKLPKAPGVYSFKKGREFLYIGKASDIRERIKNHFQQPSFRNGLFINQVEKVAYIKTDSEIEALILEANLIKKYKPKYNIVWRDDKNYFYVGVTKENFPQVFITHQPKLKINYVGPFVDGKALKETLKVLRKVFPYRTCKTLPKKPCLWYQLDRCPAPCLLFSKTAKQLPKFKSQTQKECQGNAQKLMKILQGKKKSVLANLEKVMKRASMEQDFERAARIRDQITALERILAHTRILEPQPVKTDWLKTQKVLQKILKTKGGIFRIEAYDVSNIQGKEATGSMVTFIQGKPDKNFYRRFKIKTEGKPDDVAMIKEVLRRRLKHPEWGLPDLILIDGGKQQLNAALSFKSQITSSQKMKIIAIAKKRDELYLKDRKKPILLKSLPREIFNLILQLRDEAHRFALNYHRKLRHKTLIK